MKAAIAAAAAQRMGKFWPFHDLLFQDSSQLNDQKIQQVARQLHLNQKEFNEKMKDPEVRRQVWQDIRDGFKADVRGTPTVFVNGRRLRELSPRTLQAAIDRELKKTARENATTTRK